MCSHCSDDAALESACLESWPGKKEPHQKTSQHLFSSDQLAESICFKGL